MKETLRVVLVVLICVCIGALLRQVTYSTPVNNSRSSRGRSSSSLGQSIATPPTIAPPRDSVFASIDDSSDPQWYKDSKSHFLEATDDGDLGVANVGFCHDISAVARLGPRDTPTVHAVVVNRGNVMLLANLLCSMSRIDIQHIVFLAMDEFVCPALEQKGLIDSTHVCIFYLDRLVAQMRLAEPKSVEQLDEERQTVDISNASDWGSVIHKLIITAKLYVLRDVLECGYGAFVTDVDVAFFHDPLLAFSKIFSNSSSNLTMVYQDERNPTSILSLNTGFFFLLPVAENLVFAHAILELAIWWQIDQARINIFVATGNYTNVGGWQRLPHKQFPNGKYILHTMLRKKTKFPLSPPATATHANWSGNLKEKLNMMSQTGCWFLNFNSTGSDDQCYVGELPAPEIDVDWVLGHLARNRNKK